MTVEELRTYNRDKMRRWRAENSERWHAYQRAYNKALRLRDPELMRARDRARYQRDGERMRERTNGYRAKRREIIRSLKDRACADCGGRFHWFVMQFDHRPGEAKTFVLSEGVKRSPEQILSEAAKCDVVCANCHALRTFGRGFRR